MIDNYNKYKDSLNGFLVGDALGVPVEFESRSLLKEKPVVDMKGFGSHHVPEGTWSDDSSMTLAEMDSIGERKTIDYDDIMMRFVNWYSNAAYTGTGVVFDIGITTRSALYRYTRGVSALECGGRRETDNGNGALMRMLPLAIYSYENKLSDEEEVLLIKNASLLTHGHEINQVGCKIYFDFMKKIFDNCSLEEAYEYVKNFDYKEYYSDDSIKYYDRILKGDIKTVEEKDIKSNGFVVSTLEASLWCLLNSNNYENAVLKAVNLGEDTDTVGAITGSLAGAYFGNIPNKWVSKIRNRELSDGIFDKFISCFTKEEDNHKTI